MKDNKGLFHITDLLLLVVLACTSCTFEIIKPPPSIQVAFKSSHGQYVTAMREDDGWALRQAAELSRCSWFIQHHLVNGKIALETCHGRYVTAPESGATRQDWMLGQESKLSDCGQFDLYDLGSDRVAFKTCANPSRFVTAGDGGWPGELAWSLVGETYHLEAWEIFTVLQPDTLPPVSIAAFDSCVETEGLTGVADDPGAGNSLELSHVQEAGRGCIARLEYNIVSWSAFWIKLQGMDMSPYNQLVFDIKADPQKNVPGQVKIELKRASGQEVSILYISGITTDWQTMSVNLSSFGPTDYTDPLSSFTDMEDLLFTFDANISGTTGVIYLGNIALRRAWGNQ